MSIGNIGTSGLSTSDSVELAAPVQVSPLLKLLQLSAGDKYGDAVDRAWTSGVDPTGRTIVDVGLHGCEAVAEAVRAGFLVHGFEPAPAHMANCHRLLPPDKRYDAPVEDLASGKLTSLQWWAKQRLILHTGVGAPPASSRAGAGFAFLYQAALSNTSSVGRPFTVGAGGSSSLHMPVNEAIAQGKLASEVKRVTVPVLRLDEAVDEDLWLLKMDTQGNEGHVLAGSAGLFMRRTVAHVLSEFDPRLLRRAGTPPRQVLALLHRAGFLCFDVRNPRGAPWALGRTHPLGIDAYVEAMDRHEISALKQRPAPKWAKNFGAFDDIACANAAKVWRPASVPKAVSPT